MSESMATVQCPNCPEQIDITISVSIDDDGHGGQVFNCEPDLTDVWAHHWTHEEQP